MSIKLNTNDVLNNTLNLAVKSVCEGNISGARGLIQPLSLSEDQKNRICSILEDFKKDLDDALTLKGRISIIAHENDEVQAPHEPEENALQTEIQRLSLDGSEFRKLPADGILTILFFLGMKDLFACQLVCQYFNSTTRNESLCRAIFKHDFSVGYPRQDLSLGSYQACKNSYTFHGNLLNGICTQQTLLGNQEFYGTFILLDGQPCLLNVENEIKIFNSTTGTLLKTFKGHESPSDYFIVDKARLYACFWDSTIKIWDLKTGSCLNTLQGHKKRIGSLAVYGERLYSKSSDHEIKAWDLNTGGCLASLEGHQDQSPVSSFTVFDNHLFLGYYNGTIEIWDLINRRFISLKGHHSQYAVSSFAIVDKKLCSGCYDGEIKIWDMVTRKCIKTLTLENPIGVHSLDVVCGYLCSRDNSDAIRIWDVKTGVLLNTLIPEKEHGLITSHKLSDGKLYLSFADGAIKIWDFQAKHTEVFAQIAGQLNSGDKRVVERAMERFSKMPRAARREIYQILSPSTNNDLRDQALDEQCWQEATPEQRAQAIQQYLDLQGATAIPKQPEESGV